MMHGEDRKRSGFVGPSIVGLLSANAVKSVLPPDVDLTASVYGWLVVEVCIFSARRC